MITRMKPVFFPNHFVTFADPDIKIMNIFQWF